MEDNNSEVNAGVQANMGMDFQKNSTIYLFLENYDILKEQQYFIILEHHEDIIFGYLNNSNTSELEKIETYQAKKSSTKWTNSRILEVIKKIAETSQAILDDSHLKVKDFYQENHFVTNNSIELKCKVGSNDIVYKIDEVATDYQYKELDKALQEKLKEGSKIIEFSEANKTNFETLNFKFIDIGRTPKAQFEQLVGKMVNVFGEEITDHKAALDTIFFALKDVEGKLNQRNIAELGDISKRIESKFLNDLIEKFKRKKLAYNFWRSKGDSICQALSISMFDRSIFKLHFENSFDNFKDFKEGEHQKIFDFVENNLEVFQTNFSDEDCILSFLKIFNTKTSTTLSDTQLKAAISAAHVEIQNTL